jgi:predicted nicotinamide N-methyase
MLLRFNLNSQILSLDRVTVNGLAGLRGYSVEIFVMNSQRLESTYEGQVGETSVKVAGRTLQLVRPLDPDRLLDDPDVMAWNAAEDYMPYWAYLWPGAILLGEALAAGSFEPGTRAIEIGCGLGLSGLLAVSLGLNVRFTDQDLTPLRFVDASARANGFDPSTYSTAVLDWRNLPDERYPLILGADVTYEKRLIPLVAQVIAGMLEPGGLALITDPNRTAAASFGDALKALGLATEAIPTSAETEELGPIRGTIHRVWHPVGRSARR